MLGGAVQWVLELAIGLLATVGGVRGEETNTAACLVTGGWDESCHFTACLECRTNLFFVSLNCNQPCRGTFSHIRLLNLQEHRW